MAAELRLNVGLDLAYFKSQLPKLAQAAAGFQLPVKVRIDGKQLQKELNKISGRREYRINLNDTSIKSAIDNVKTLKRELDSVERKSQRATAASTPIGTGRLSKTAGQGGVTAAEIQALYQQAAIQGVAGFEKGIKIKRGDAVKELAALSADAIKGLIVGLRKGRGTVEDAAEGLADALVDSMEDRLGIRSPSFRLMKTGEYAAEGFEIGLTKGLQEAERSAVARMQAMLRALQGEAAKFGPALLMASGMGGGRGGDVRSAALMAGGMAGLFTPETEMQRERRQIDERIAGRYGSPSSASFQGGGTGGQFRFGAAPASVYGGVPRQQLALPSAEMLEAGRTMKAFAQAADQANDLIRRKLANAERAATQGSHFSQTAGGGGSRSGGGSGGGGGFRHSKAFNIPDFPSLPGVGAVRELTAEFGNATKQVLLFGTAYKGLAFLMDFPAQVKDAVASLQSFRNTLNAIIPDASKAAEANQFILDTVDKYNVPLKTARDGFVKLYASMEPAGFGGQDVEELFLGISQAAATFGLSADKVDRVQYAFAQMASKGQIMSEELKGQLGDVLPGAMGLFAKAAGLDGPDAIQKFSKAMEDGAFKGENMMALLRNVAKTMQEDFGAGAEGAAKSFQGLMNDMQTSLTKLYEAFEPLAVEFLQGFVLPLTKGLKTAADGLTAFFKGARASTKDGQALADKLEGLRESFDGIKANIDGVLDAFKSLGQLLGPIAELFVRIAGSPLAGFLMRLYVIILPMNIALKIMKTLWATNAVQLAVFSARVKAGKATLTAFRGMMAATGKTAKVTSASIRGLGVALKGALASTGVGLIVVGIGMIIEKLMTMGDKAREAAAEVLRLKNELKAAAEMGEVMPLLNNLTKAQGTYDKELKKLRGMEDGSLVQHGAHGSTYAFTDAQIQAQREKVVGLGANVVDAQELFNKGVDQAQANTAAAAASDVSLEKISLDGSGDGSGSSSDKPMSADALAINEALNQKRREGNELALAHLELAAELQSIKEQELSATDEQAALDDARTKHLLKTQKIREKNDKDAQQALEEQKASRFTLAGILLEAQYASGAISEEEYKTEKFLREQEATRRRILELPGLTDEERQGAVNALPTAPPEEKGDIANWIEKTEEEVNNFEGMATEAADGIASEFGTAFSNILQGTTSISEGLSNAFANISKMFADMVMQMLAKWAMLQVMKSLFPGMADGGVVNASGGGGGVSLVPQMANGGIVKGPTMAMVGEGRFNEAVVPLPNGKAIPVDMGKGGGGNVNSSVVVNINNGGGSESSTKGSQGNQLAKGIEGAVKDVIMREMRPGGMIASGR